MTSASSPSPPSRRRDGDSWDLASGVGATATAVATARALATRDGVIDDQFAEPLVRAVGEEHFLEILDGRAEQGDRHRMALGMAVRTIFFDQFLFDACATGIQQVVILASGLDARGYRLPWPDGTVVFDLDTPDVIGFKAAALQRLGAHPTADVRNVGVDLRDDWPSALRANGFSGDARTAWIAEGLLMYLPPDAQDRLFDHITALCPAGSRLATEFIPDMSAFTDVDDGGQSRWRRMGFSDDLAGLVYAGERNDVTSYLQGLSWQLESSLVGELFERYGIERTPDEHSEKFAGFQYVRAVLG